MFDPRERPSDVIEAGAVPPRPAAGWVQRLLGGGDDVILHSRLSPIALAEKLQDIFGSGGDAAPVDNVIGHGSEQDMTLYAASAGAGGKYFKAELTADGSGTRIAGRFHKNAVLKWVPIMFLVVGSIFLFTGIGMLFEGDDVPIMLPAIFIGLPLVQWVFLYGVMKMFRHGAGKEKEQIIAFLKKHCEVD